MEIVLLLLLLLLLVMVVVVVAAETDFSAGKWSDNDDGEELGLCAEPREDVLDLDGEQVIGAVPFLSCVGINVQDSLEESDTSNVVEEVFVGAVTRFSIRHSPEMI